MVLIIRNFCLAIAFLLAIPAAALHAQSEPSQAGIVRITVAASPPFDALVWYPTLDDGVLWQTGAFLLPAIHNAAVAAGRYPIVLLSHGGGKGGGSPMILGDIAAALARSGDIVIAPFHGDRAPALRLRPPQMLQALAAVLADARFKDHADPARLGMLGFSLGGAVALSLAGAVPDPAHFVTYCDEHPADAASCLNAPGAGSEGALREALVPSIPKPVTLKALALLDPFAAIYDRDGLASVTMPVMIFRPRDSVLGLAGNAMALQADLPKPPIYEVIPGSHFVFADICPAVLQPTDTDLCEDPPGVNRAAIHAYVAPRIARFFANALAPAPPPPAKVTAPHPAPIVPPAPTGGIR